MKEGCVDIKYCVGPSCSRFKKGVREVIEELGKSEDVNIFPAPCEQKCGTSPNVYVRDLEGNITPYKNVNRSPTDTRIEEIVAEVRRLGNG